MDKFLGDESLLKERGVEVIVAGSLECRELMKTVYPGSSGNLEGRYWGVILHSTPL